MLIFPRTRIAALTAFAGLFALTVATPAPANAAAPIKAAAVTGAVSGRIPLGTFASGQRKSGNWQNANSDAYQVAIVPSISDQWSCEFQLVKTVYWRNSSGVRQLGFEIENAGVDGCTADVVIIKMSAFTSWSTGSIRAGAWKSWTWNNANPLTAVYNVGYTPDGNGCQFQTTHMVYRRQTNGEREFAFTVKNVGSSTCSATVNLVQLPSSQTFAFNGLTVPPGPQVGPGFSATSIVGGMIPEVNPAGVCSLEMDRYSYLRSPDHTDGSLNMNAGYDYTNTSSLNCGVQWSAAFLG